MDSNEEIDFFRLLYKLGLNSTFLRRLWTTLGSSRNIENELKGCYLVSWRDCHTRLSVFCDMFTFYTQALTDRGNLHLILCKKKAGYLIDFRKF